MGNSIGGKRRSAKVVKIDGSSFRVKPPGRAIDVLREHPGFSLLDAEDVKQLGVRARGLGPEAFLAPGRLYFLVEIPRLPDQRTPRRAWSGALQMSARDRLESLKLYRRTVSDLSGPKQLSDPPAPAAAAERGPDGALRLRMRLPKAQVAKLMEESKDASEAAHKIFELCASMDGPAGAGERTPRPPSPAVVRASLREKRTRFVAMPDEIIT